MKFKATLIYRLSWIACMSIMLAVTSQVNAGVVNVQFANPTVNCVAGVPTTFCVTLQVRAQTGTFKIGNSTAFFQYNANTINNPVKTAGSDAAFSTGSGYGFAPQFSSLEQGNIGEGNFNVLLGAGAGTPTTDVTSTAWTNMAQFCFTIVNSAGTANISFNTTYTGFNDQTNNPANSHTLGTSSPLSGGLSACSVVGTVVQLKAHLEGSYNTTNGNMNKSLNTANLIPLAQPYNQTPWNYTGTETIASLPTTMVDWVIVSAATLAGSTWTIVERKAAMILQDGSIVDPTGGSATGVTFNTLTSGGSYYFLIRHRTHIPTVSSSPIVVPNVSAYDFGLANQSITIGATTYTQQKTVGTGGNQKWVLRTGNANGDNNINTSDRNSWSANNPSTNVYKNQDFSMDGQVNTADRNRWNANNPYTGFVVPQQ